MDILEQTERKHKIATIVRIVVLILVVAILIGLASLSTSQKPPAGQKVWDEKTTVGSLEAKNHYVMYTDILCPYCDVFSRLTLENKAEFEQFLADNDVLFELRITDTLYQAKNVEYSRMSAEGVYCAKKEGKFWDYYYEAVESLWRDYHSKGIGSSVTAPPITDMTEDYWLAVGHRVGLGEDFDSCVKNHETVEEITENTYKAAGEINNGGLPFFQFNRFVTSGFDPRYGWDYALMMLESGLKS